MSSVVDREHASGSGVTCSPPTKSAKKPLCSRVHELFKARVAWLVVTLGVCVAAGIGYFWGIRTALPLSFGDLAPWPDISFWKAGSLYFEVYRTANLPGQFTVGLGAPNAPTAFLLVQTALGSAFQSVSVAEVVFFGALIPISSVCFWLLSSIWTTRPVIRCASAVFYALNPLPLLVLLPGGNPSELLWYAILPLVVHGSLRFIERGFLRYAYEVLLSVALAGTIVYEYSILSVGFVVLPAALLYLLGDQTRTTLRRVVGLLVASISSAFVTLFLSAPLIAYVSAGFSSSGSSYFSQIQPGFPGPLQLLLYDVPSMGATFYWPYSVNVEGSILFSFVAIGAWVVILLPLLGVVGKGLGSLSRIPTILCLLVLFLYFGNWTGLSAPLYATVPAFDLVDWPIKLFPVVSLAIVCDSVLCADFVIEHWRDPNQNRLGTSSPRARLARRFSPFTLSSPASGSNTLKVVVVASLVLLASYCVATEWGMNLETGLANSEPSTYVSEYLPGVADLLEKARQAVGVQGARDLWLPIDGYATMENSIISIDPSALFFANTLNPSVSTGNGQAAASAFAGYSLTLLISNKTDEIGKFLAQQGVAFVVVLTAQVSFHAPYTKWDGAPYSGPPYLTSQGWVIGNPQWILAQVKAQTDLRIEAANSNATVFFNLDYLGGAWASGLALFSQDQSLYETSNPTLLDLSDLPGEGGAAPTVSVGSPGQLSPSLAAVLCSPLPIAQACDAGYPALSLFDSQELSDVSNGSSGVVRGSDGVSISGVVSQYNQSLPAGLMTGGAPIFNGSTPVFSGGRSVTIPWNVSWALWNETNRSFSLSIWVRTQAPPQGSVDQSVFSQGSAYSVFLNPMSQELYMSVQWEHSENTSFFGVAIRPGSWYLATLTYDGRHLAAYDNSSLIGEMNLSDVVGFRPGFPFAIGGNGQYANQEFNGSISNLRIFSEALTTTEVAELYSAGPNATYSLSGDPGIVYFPLNKTDFVPGRLTISVSNPDIRTIAVLGGGTVSLVLPDSSTALSGLTMTNSWSFANLSGFTAHSVTLESWAALLEFVVVSSGEDYGALLEGLVPQTAVIQSVSSDHVVVSLPARFHWLYWSDTYDPAWSVTGELTVMHFASLTGNVFGPFAAPANQSLAVSLQYNSLFSPYLAYLLFLPLLFLVALPYLLDGRRRLTL